MAGATLTMLVGHDKPPLGQILPVTWTGVVGHTPSPSSISLDVTAAQTGVLSPGLYDYTLTATLTDGDTVTVAVGKLTVQGSPTTPPIFS
jgi:hypothetical protein